MQLSLSLLLSALVPRDVLGAKVAAAAAGVLAAVLLWHFVAMVRERRWAEWTCWSAGVIAAITAVWLVALLTGDVFDNAWTKLALLTLLAIATAIIFYHTVYHYLGPARILLLLALRCAAIVVLVLLLFKPAVANRPADSDRPTLILLVDRSQSMSEADGGAGRTRYAAVVDAILAEQTRLETFFDVKYFVFDKSAEAKDAAADLADLKPTGEGTFYDAAMMRIASALADPRCKGAVLFSDGIHNGVTPALVAAADLPKPLLTVGVGGPVAEGAAGRDVEISQVTAPEQAICKNVTAVNVDIRGAGFAGQPATAVLRAAGGEELARADIKLTDGVVPAKIEFTPRQVGVMDLELDVGRLDAAGKLGPLPGETVASNNRHTLSMRVGEPRIKVLYVEGRIRPECRELTRTLGEDPQLELMTLVQVRAPGAGAVAAAEFRVFGSAGGKQIAGMPATADQFKMFDVIVIGDLDRTYLSADQMKLMQEGVRTGKGLLMFGGSHSLGPGGYGGSMLEQMLPVELGQRTIGQETTPFRLALTQKGRTHPIFSGIADVISPPPAAPATNLPELSGCVKVVAAKPDADVLAVHPTRQTPDGKSPLPVLTVQSYGGGRTAVFTADTTGVWRRFEKVAAYGDIHQRFWGQLVRWLASSELIDKKQPSAAVMNLPRSFYTPDEPLPVSARVWDKDGLPADGARVTVKVTTPAGKGGEFELTPVRDQPGLYQSNLPAQLPGAVQLAMTATKTGVQLGANDRKLEVGQPGAEAAVRSAKPDVLQMLSSVRHGLIETQYVPVSQWPRMVDQLTARYQQARLNPEPERVWPNYDSSVLQGAAMLVFITLLSVEWLLRRRWQLQ
ncbi:MAG: glutamine amidotransferase [Phycisphaerae bacterium]|nr:glutamine amidotransferase [Phycisphaerae bacterium]